MKNIISAAIVAVFAIGATAPSAYAGGYQCTIQVKVKCGGEEK